MRQTVIRNRGALHLNRFRRFYLILAMLLLPLMAMAQEYENLNVFGVETDSSYFLQLKFEFQESDRSTKETGFYDVFQEKNNTEAKSNIGLGYVHIDGLYKDYHSRVTIANDETRLSSRKSSLGSWVELFDYFYIFGQQKDIRTHYRFDDNLVRSFEDNEKAGSTIYGLGMVFGLWRFGLALGSSVSWEYTVGAADQEIIAESLDFDVDVIEIIRKSERTEGSLFYELGLKNRRSSDVAANRVASMSQTEIYGVLGMGVSPTSDLYIGHKQTRGTIRSTLLSDATALSRTSKYANSLLGIQIEIGEESAIYLESDYSNQNINLSNISFGSDNKHKEQKYTLGYLFNQSMSLELKIGQTSYEKSYYENKVNNANYHYLQVDNYLGLSIHIQFSG